MSTNVLFNGSTYVVPAVGEDNWGDNVSDYLIAIAAGALQKTGGTFSLTSDVNFGSSYGLKSKYFTSITANASTAGAVRLANTESVSWRNAANSANLALSVDASNNLVFDGTVLGPGNDFTLKSTLTAKGSTYFASAASTPAELVIGTNNFVMVADSAQSVGAKWAAILNVNIDAAAAIARSKLANGTVSHVLINDGSGVMSSEAILAKSRGGTGYDLTTQAIELPSISTPSTPSAGFGKAYFKSDGQLYQLNDAGVESAVGSGGSSGNLISNGTFESNATGWVTYADGAAIPTDGTGGSPTATFARSTSSPIDGVGSGLYTPGALGNGVSYDFSQTSAFVRQLQVSFSANIGSYANFTDGDITVWIYDVTNSALIQPVPYSVLKANGTSQWQGVFQTSATGVSYRLLIHQATATSTYTLKIDDVVVSPQLVPQGVPALDWQAFTPTGSWSTNTTYTGYWRRVGDSAEYNVQVALSGAPTSAQLTINLASGQSIDTTKLVSSTSGQNVLGQVTILDSGTQNYRSTEVRYQTATSVGIWGAGSAVEPTEAYHITNTIPFTFANNDRIWVTFKVPIVGWSSNAQLSVPSIDRIIVADAYYSTAATVSLTNGADNVVNLVTTRFDSTGAISLGSESFTAPVSGYYKISAYARLAGAAVYVYAYAGIGGVSSSATLLGSVLTSVADNNYTFAPRIIYLTAGQVVTYILNPAGASLTYDNPTGMQVERVTGPQQILSGMTVGARYTTVAANTVTNGNSATIATYVKDYDYTNSFNATTGIFTVPVAGLYTVNGTFTTDTISWSSGANRYVELKLGGTKSLELVLMPTIVTIASYIGLPFSSTSYFNAGDTISIVFENRSGVTTTLVNNILYNYVSFTRVGS